MFLICIFARLQRICCLSHENPPRNPSREIITYITVHRNVAIDKERDIVKEKFSKKEERESLCGGGKDRKKSISKMLKKNVKLI